MKVNTVCLRMHIMCFACVFVFVYRCGCGLTLYIKMKFGSLLIEQDQNEYILLKTRVVAVCMEQLVMAICSKSRYVYDKIFLKIYSDISISYRYY